MIRIFSLLLFCVLISVCSFAQTAKPAPKKVAPKTGTTVRKAQPVKKKVSPVKADTLYLLDSADVLSGKVIKVMEDTVTYYPTATPKILKRIPTSQLTKIVYANGVIKIIEARKADEGAKEEVKAAKEETQVAEKVPAPDEIVLKSGEVIQGRISSQQKFKIGYKPVDSTGAVKELFVSTSKIWKLRYAVNGQEVILNPMKENSGKEKQKKNGAAASKSEKPIKEKPPKPVRAEKSHAPAERIYRPFKVDITTGYSRLMSADADVNFGINFSIEPKYNITDNIAAGFKFEGTGFFFGDTDTEEGAVLLMKSYSLTGEYLVGTRKVRPYFGMAIGLYQPTTYIMYEEDIYREKLDNVIGFAPRAGIHFGKFRLGAEFNVAKDSKLDIDYGYLSIKMGATIGGGKKKR